MKETKPVVLNLDEYITNDEVRIGNGKDAQRPIPWQVSIRASYRKNFGKSICGGTILNKKTVLTAAHCVDENTTFAIVVGALFNDDLDDKDYYGHQVQFINATTILHPDYNARK